MKAIVIYESLTGNTRDAGDLIASELRASGVETMSCSVDRVDLQWLSDSDLVIVGTWVDGLFFFGQKPGRPWKLAKIPVIDGKKAAIFCTYAHDPGKVLDKLQGVVERRGGDVIGGFSIKRNDIIAGASEFVDRLWGASALQTERASV
ncbi:MAG: flavodoxin family protein [Acidimicrobiales bacterium]